MALSIKSEEADRLARELAAITGETLTTAIVVALKERLQRERGAGDVGLAQRLGRLADDVAALPVQDQRPISGLIQYDDQGLPR